MNWYGEIYEIIHTIINIYSLIAVLIALVMLFTKKHYWKYFWISNLAVLIISLLSILIYNVVEITILKGFVYPVVLSILIYNWCFIICMIINYIIYRISRHNMNS